MRPTDSLPKNSKKKKIGVGRGFWLRAGRVDLTNKTQNNGVFLDPLPVGLPGFTGGCNRGFHWPRPETCHVSGSHIHNVFAL